MGLSACFHGPVSKPKSHGLENCSTHAPLCNTVSELTNKFKEYAFVMWRCKPPCTQNLQSTWLGFGPLLHYIQNTDSFESDYNLLNLSAKNTQLRYPLVFKNSIKTWNRKRNKAFRTLAGIRQILESNCKRKLCDEKMCYKLSYFAVWIFWTIQKEESRNRRVGMIHDSLIRSGFVRTRLKQ